VNGEHGAGVRRLVAGDFLECRVETKSELVYIGAGNIHGR
jgi:hypothetical protein